METMIAKVRYHIKVESSNTLFGTRHSTIYIKVFEI